MLNVLHYEKHVFSTYISWSSLSLPTTKKSCIIAAAHPLVKRGSCRLFRFSSWRDVTTGEIFMCWPPQSFLIFNDNVPATIRLSLFVYANHFKSDCFCKEGQYKAGFASTLTLIKGSVPTIWDPATAPEPQVSVATFGNVNSCQRTIS